ncbi:DUF885 domain-containing protein [Nigerium massiliense]|uniref:DUF885 domain-containing protein n=1 Tax=Nigerium massiliense TaxID=1522317 RepID=UPI00058CA1DD|nr:DUF885 domain-containing protein [Nigerium massiliense]
MRTPSAIDRIADDYTHAYAALRPLEATAMGLPGYDHLMGDHSPASHDAVADLNRRTLAALDEADVADDTDRVTVAAMRDRLGLDLERHEAGEHLRNLNNIECPVQSFRDIFDQMPTSTTADWTTVAERLGGLPEAVDGFLACLEEGRSRGLRPSRLQTTDALGQAETLADPASSFFVAFTRGARPDGAEPGADLAQRLTSAGDAAAAAYGRLAAYLRDTVLPDAVEDPAFGRERYRLASRLFVGAEVDLDETYEWGLATLAEIAAEMEALAEKIAGPGASVADAVATLNADPDRILHGTDELQRWMQRTSDQAIADLDGTHFDISEKMHSLECCIAPTQNGGIYYTGPSDDFSRPGRMWWSVPPGVTEFTTWAEKTTVYHEGVPGHHLQIAQAVQNSAELNLWRRLACWISGHGEGWALYAERLMDEFGHLSDDGDRFGMLDSQRLRATRVVLDIGFHLKKEAPAEYGGGVWDYDKAWNLLRSNVLMEEKALRFELHRYLGWAGQAPSYRLGQRVWEQVREEARQVAEGRGEEFSLKEFHTRALNLGALPLDVLRAEMTR